MYEDTKDAKNIDATVERYETMSDGDQFQKPRPDAMGTVTLTATEDVFLIPAPSADPRGASVSFQSVLPDHSKTP
jgi:hypothetical protein